jgi:signal peptidase II
MHKPYRGVGRWLWLAGLVIVLDQLSKLGFDAQLKYGERIHVLPFFDFTLLYNPGAAFSFLADETGWQRWFFTVLAIAASVFIVWMMHKNTTQHRMMLALITLTSPWRPENLSRSCLDVLNSNEPNP